MIRSAGPNDRDEWLRLRTALWPTASEKQHDSEMAGYLADETTRVLVAVRPTGGLAGFVEASTRPKAEGCETTPVGYVEGWYVDPDVRRRGIGARLFEAAERWARDRGFAEMGSDCLVGNDVSLAAHTALGYEERERLIHFRKWLKLRDANNGT